MRRGISQTWRVPTAMCFRLGCRARPCIDWRLQGLEGLRGAVQRVRGCVEEHRRRAVQELEQAVQGAGGAQLGQASRGAAPCETAGELGTIAAVGVAGAG